MTKVIFRQQLSRKLHFWFYSVMTIWMLGASIVLGRAHPPAVPRVFGVYGTMFVFSIIVALLAIRSWRQCVILQGGTLLVRTITGTRHVHVDDAAEFGLFRARFMAAVVIGVRKKNGRVIRFPFYARSRIVKSSQNDRARAMAQKIEQIVRDHQAGLLSTSEVVDY